MHIKKNQSVNLKIQLIGRIATSFSTKTMVSLIAFYQKCISPALGPHCRFYPSCSEYARLAILKHGPIKGTAKSLNRLCRCQPFHSGGVDFP